MIALNDYIFKDRNDKKSIHFSISYQLFHENKACKFISDFDLQKQGLGQNLLKGTFIIDSRAFADFYNVGFKNTIQQSLNAVEDIKKTNNEFLTMLMVSIYMGFDYRNRILSKDVIKNNFDSVSDFLPNEDLDFFKRVIVDDENLNYYNYVIQKSIDNGGQDKGKSYAKTTPYQTGVVFDEVNNNKGFTKTVFLSAIIITIVILVMFAIFIFIRR